MNLRQAISLRMEQFRPLVRSILTVGRRTVFWCDSHKWLCFCCHRFRDAYIRRLPGAFDKFAFVWNRWGSGWIWVLDDIRYPIIIIYKLHMVVITPPGMVYYTKIKGDDCLDLMVNIGGHPIRVVRERRSELITIEVRGIEVK